MHKNSQMGSVRKIEFPFFMVSYINIHHNHKVKKKQLFEKAKSTSSISFNLTNVLSENLLHILNR